MTTHELAVNRVREYRTWHGLTQAGLAQRAGISRTAVTAIEGGRLVPSVAAALALADALDTTVEALFGRAAAAGRAPKWASDPGPSQRAFWEAEVGGQQWLYPAESSPMLTPLPDGAASGAGGAAPTAIARKTLVIACCDPAAGLLASAFAHKSELRLLVLQRSGRQALELLRQGKVHAAGLHFSTRDEPDRNVDVVRETLGNGYRLLTVARWQEGIAATPASRLRSVRGALKTRLRWVGREPGSGARQCLDRLWGSRPAPRRLARNHRGVAEAIHAGWADAGVCVQLTGLEAGLTFLPVQEEAYELCVPMGLVDDPRIQSLIHVVRSVEYRQLLSQLPGYDTTDTGSLSEVN
jgi:molybdate-binding protein/DNA-binding XRE family transcriptional regulator